MYSQRSWPFRAHHVSSTPQNAATSEESGVIASSACIHPPAALQPRASLQRPHSDVVGKDASDSRWDPTLAIASILSDIPTLQLALVGPLTQIANVVSDTIDDMNFMHDDREECAHLVARVLRFLRSLIADLRGSSAPIADGTPTAARLFALRRCVSRRHCM